MKPKLLFCLPAKNKQQKTKQNINLLKCATHTMDIVNGIFLEAVCSLKVRTYRHYSGLKNNIYI